MSRLTIEEQLKKHILSQYRSVRAFTQSIGIPYSTVDTMFKRGIGGAGINTVIKIFHALNLEIESIETGCLKPSTTNTFNLSKQQIKDVSLSEHEKNVIEAYRKNPEMQPAVDKLLGVEKDKDFTILPKVARDKNSTNENSIKLSNEQLEILHNAKSVESEDDL